MDISKATALQKTTAAIAYLSKNIDKAPEALKKGLEKLDRVNSEGMELVQQINSLKAQIEALDGSIGEKIGAAKVLFEILGEQLTSEQADEFAKLFEPRQIKKDIDIVGAKEKIILDSNESILSRNVQ